MKVCIVCDYLPKYHKLWSGAELIAVALANMLDRKGCEVFFLTTPVDFSAAQKDCFEIHPLSTPLKRFGALSRNFPIDVVALRGIHKVLREKKPDVVHIHAKYLYLHAMIACLRLHIPTVFTVPDYFIFCPTTFIRKPDGEDCRTYHGKDCCQCLSVLSDGYLKKLCFAAPKIFTQAFLCLRAREFDYFNKKVNSFVALSRRSRQRLINYGIAPEKVRVIYHYKLAESSPIKEDIENPSAVYAGWLSEENGVDILIDAFLDVLKTTKVAKLYLIGVGKEQFVAQLRDKIRGHGASNNIIFLGKKGNSEVLTIISRCDFVVVPHQWPKEFGPVILLEALAMGKPVIASRIGATEEYVKDGETGFLIEQYKNPLAFSERIDFLFKRPQMVAEMGERARQAVSFLFDDSSGERMLELYGALTN